MKNYFLSFIIFGMIGWSVEIIYTALYHLIMNDIENKWTLQGHTYLWMFPIYGIISVFCPLYYLMKKKGYKWYIIYTIGVINIYLIEYILGYLLEKYIGKCPWDYTDSSIFQIHGYIRLDYILNWYLFILLIDLIYNNFVLHLLTKKTEKIL